jgi:diketogulonate reductase-like aldo/keto reductase
VPLADTLGAMAEAREAGRVRHIGVSNFTVALLEGTARLSPAPIFCNQVEYHPYLSQEPVLEKCRELDVPVVAYCPLARGRTLQDPVLREIGDRHGKTAGQVALRWLIQQEGVGAIPRSGSAEHQRENMDIFDFELAEAEMRRVFELARGHRIVGSAGGSSPDWDT